MQSEIDHLRGVLVRRDAELERSQQAEAELRRIIAGMVGRLPELPAHASRPEQEPFTLAESDPEPHAPAVAPPEPAQRPWWRFWR